MKKILFFSLLLSSVVLFTQCNKDDDDTDGGTTPTTTDCTTTPTYTGTVKAILDASCATSGCHDADTAANDIDLSTYALASTASTFESFLKSIQHADGVEAMPLGGDKLSDATIESIDCWIQGGSPE